jgi:hypothetical protein
MNLKVTADVHAMSRCTWFITITMNTLTKKLQGEILSRASIITQTRQWEENDRDLHSRYVLAIVELRVIRCDNEIFQRTLHK